MKRNAAFILFGVLILALTAGCQRGIRRLQDNPTEQSQPATATSALQPSPTETPLQVTLAATLAPTVAPLEPTATVASIAPTATTGQSQSDQLAGQLDDLLKQFDQQLGSVDTIDETS